uniref:Putative secreted protein n=1 Tax=Ixodes ricinus TaxID=34613 RepID=A0A6B0U9F1_IXORI
MLSSSSLLSFCFVSFHPFAHPPHPPHFRIASRHVAVLDLCHSSRYDNAGLDVMAPSVLPLRCVVKKRRKYSTITLEKKATVLKLTESCRTQTEA